MSSGTLAGYCLMLMTYTISTHMFRGMLLIMSGGGSGVLLPVVAVPVPVQALVIVVIVDEAVEPRFKDDAREFTYLSTLIAHKLKIEAVHNRTSSDIQISHKTQPSCQEPQTRNNHNHNHNHNNNNNNYDLWLIMMM
uniref:Uncharacterized protein n=1 Tax=Glossina brevipalpis TaxID=37001 RepID=A0A1A9WBU9_9MUSC